MGTIGEMGGEVKEHTVLEPGEYKLRCQEADVKPAKSGNLQIKWDVVEVNTGKELTFYSSLHPNAQSITKQWLLAFGCNEDDPMPEDEIGWTQYLRRVCKGKVAVAQLDIESKPSTRKDAKPGDVFKFNVVKPPWEIHSAKEALDLEDGQEKPDWLK